MSERGWNWWHDRVRALLVRGWDRAAAQRTVCEQQHYAEKWTRDDRELASANCAEERRQRNNVKPERAKETT